MGWNSKAPLTWSRSKWKKTAQSKTQPNTGEIDMERLQAQKNVFLKKFTGCFVLFCRPVALVLTIDS